MNRKGLAILMRTRIRPSLSSLSSDSPTTISQSPPMKKQEEADVTVMPENSKVKQAADEHQRVDFRDLMSIAMSNQTSSNLDAVLNSFSEGYYSLCDEKRKELLLVLANEYDLDRAQLRQLMKQYLDVGDGVAEEESILPTPFYRVEANLRNALMPKYQLLFQRLNANPGGFKFLTLLRARVLSIIKTENSASLRALDSCLKELLITCLSPAALHLHHITWDDPASLLEKIVAYEAVHPISSLLDLKRRLGLGRRCFGYLHPAMPGEPLIFIEVALLKNVAQSIQEVLWDSPPIPESEATCALFYSISSTQPGLAGVNLGQFLIKRVIDKVKKEMPHVTDFATLSPIPGFMTWLLSKLASQSKLSQEATTDIVGSSMHNVGSAFREYILLPEEERQLVQASGTSAIGTDGMEVMWNLLKSRDYEWSKSEKLCSALQPALMRLCARYLLQEKLRGKALDSVANFHLQNGAMMERLNWMADRSEKGLTQSGGIMVNFIYRLDSIEENSKSYFSTGHINASIDIQHLIEQK